MHKWGRHLPFDSVFSDSGPKMIQILPISSNESWTLQVPSDVPLVLSQALGPVRCTGAPLCGERIWRWRHRVLKTSTGNFSPGRAMVQWPMVWSTALGRCERWMARVQYFGVLLFTSNSSEITRTSSILKTSCDCWVCFNPLIYSKLLNIYTSKWFNCGRYHTWSIYVPLQPKILFKVILWPNSCGCSAWSPWTMDKIGKLSNHFARIQRKKCKRPKTMVCNHWLISGGWSTWFVHH